VLAVIDAAGAEIAHRWLTANNLQLPGADWRGAPRVPRLGTRSRVAAEEHQSAPAHLRLYFRFVVGHELPGSTKHSGHRRHFRKDFEMGLQRVRKPSSRQVRAKEARTIIEPLEIEQVRELLSNFRRYRDLCIAHLMLLCGLRTGEVIYLRRGDVAFEDRRIRVFGKGANERAVPLPALLVDLLNRYLVLERPDTARADHLFLVLQTMLMRKAWAASPP